MELLMSSAAICLVCVVILIWTRRRRWPDANLPSVKGALPLLGNLHQVDRNRIYLDITRESKNLGPVYLLNMAGDPFVVVSGYDLIHTVYIKQSGEFAARPPSFRLDYTTLDRRGVVTADMSPKFKAIKNAMFRSLKIHSGGIERMEQFVNDMGEELFEELRKHKGVAFDIREPLYNFLLQVVYFFVLGEYVSLDDKRFPIMREAERILMSNLGPGSGAELDVMPWLRYFGNQTYTNLKKGMDLTRIIWATHRERLYQTLEEGEAQCAMHDILELQKTLKDEDGNMLIDDDECMISMMNLVLAGITTTGPTLYVLLNLMANRPDIQNKIHEELDRVLEGRRVTGTDRDKLHYTRATLLEVLRNAPSVAVNLRKAVVDTKLGGYFIPKDTGLMINIWGMHHDPELWGDDPYYYKPERFLDAEGHLVTQDHPARKHLLPFGAGPRVCVGEMFAMARMFLITATLLQHFEILPASDGSTSSADPRLCELGLTLYPPKSNIRLIDRKNN